MKTTRKTIVFFILAFAFVVGCQGQYPEKQAVDVGQCDSLETVIDSAMLVIYYQPLTEGVRWNIGESYKPHPEKYRRRDRVTVYSGSVCTYDRLKTFSDDYRRLMQGNSEPCGFYKVDVKYSGDIIFTNFFTKCNPNYIGRNDYGVDPDNSSPATRNIELFGSND